MRSCLLLTLVITLPLAAQPDKRSKPDTSRGDKLLDDYFRAQVKQISERCLTDLTTKEDWEKRRPELRRQFLDMMGLWPLPPKGDLKATITGKVDAENFTVENLHFQSSPGLYVTGNLFIPRKAKFPAPAVLYVCGHSKVVIDGVSYGNRTAYQHHAIWYAEHGYVCLIIDTLELGEILGEHHGTSREGMWWWQTLGYTPAGVELWNAMRAVDYLQTRKEVDPKRIGVAGRSGGGATSWWLMAADERVQCAVPVAGIADLHAHVVEGAVPRFKKGVISGHCDCMYFVNTYRWDFPMVAALCAPRPVLLGNSDADEIFPVAGYKDLAARARKVYKLYGAEEKFGLLETKGPHKDSPELRLGEYAWMNRWLQGDTGEVTDPERPKIDVKKLKVFDRLPGDAINATIHESFIKAARPEIPKDGDVKAWWKAKREEWVKVLKEQVFRGWPEKPPPLDVKAAGEVKKHGLRLRAFGFLSEEGVPLRLWVMTGDNGMAPKSVSLAVYDETRWANFVDQLGADFSELLQALTPPTAGKEKTDVYAKEFKTSTEAYIIVAPRGIGPTRWAEVATPADNHVKRKFALIGQTLDGQRVWDVRRALAVVRSVADLKGLTVQLTGEGPAAGLVLYAALFEPEVHRIQLGNLPASHARGPTFLNVRRYFDMPQAVALALDREVYMITTFDRVEKDDPSLHWAWPVALEKALGQKSLKFAAALD